MFEKLSTRLCNSLNRHGNVALYAIVFLLVGVVLSIVIFFPQFLNMQSGIYGISCREIRQKIQVAVEDHDANNSKSIVEPGKRIDIDTLKEKGFLNEIKLCPEKGEYKFDERGKVICTFHKTGE
ncbi:MAG: hypothetical protein PHD82_05490 [Candidatus Riflebacteria bacterium]|jgi:hypothetical protein|nr:hypothetical protein [Candidatus Riflebacteria bacterium]